MKRRKRSLLIGIPLANERLSTQFLRVLLKFFLESAYPNPFASSASWPTVATNSLASLKTFEDS